MLRVVCSHRPDALGIEFVFRLSVVGLGRLRTFRSAGSWYGTDWTIEGRKGETVFRFCRPAPSTDDRKKGSIMQSRSFLQLLAPWAFAALLFGCGSDGAGDKGSEPAVKKDAGSKKKDAGSKATKTDDESADAEEDDSSSAQDAGAHKPAAKGGKVEITGDSEDIACEKDTDCPADEMSDSVGCCDQPTKVCFMSEGDKCPKSTGTGFSQPAYR